MLSLIRSLLLISVVAAPFILFDIKSDAFGGPLMWLFIYGVCVVLLVTVIAPIRPARNFHKSQPVRNSLVCTKTDDNDDNGILSDAMYYHPAHRSNMCNVYYDDSR